MLALTGLPAYALGGVGAAQLGDALLAGCVGVAGIGGFWSGERRLDDAALVAGLGAEGL